MIKHSVINRIIYSIFAVLYSWALTACIVVTMNFEVQKSFIFLCCLLLVVFLNMLYINKKTLIGGGVFAVMGIAYTLYYLRATDKLDMLRNDVLATMQWFYGYIMGYVQLDSQYSVYITIVMTLMICAYVFWAMVRNLYFYILLSCGLIYMIFTLVLGFEIYVWGFMVYGLCILCLMVRERAYKLKKYLSNADEYTEPLIMAGAMPFIAIVLLSAYWIAGTSEQYQMQWMHTKVADLNNWYAVQDWHWSNGYGYGYGTGNNFSLVSTGFQPNRDSIGGDVAIDERLVMNVKADRRLYLKGSIRDYYTGNNWISTRVKEFAIKDPRIDGYVTDSYYSSKPMFFALLKYLQVDPRKFKQLYDEVFITGEVEIAHVNLRTNTLFYPDNLVELLDISDYSELLMNSNGEFYFPGRRRNDHVYKSDYRIIDRSNPVTEEILKQSTRMENAGIATENKNIIEKYDEVYEKYTVTDNVSLLVRNLAREITEDSDNRYDKTVAIEQYLSQQYTYTLTPGYTPADRDFVEHFLFESQKGYCTYYASAMTVMVRSLGIPARYVEGFVMPIRSGEDGIYRVTTKLSHAWVEVFFDGFGWVRFEPTSPYQQIFHATPEELQRNAGEHYYQEYDMYDEYMRHLMGEMDLYGLDDFEFDPSKVEQEEQLPQQTFMWNYILLALLSTLIAVVSIVFIRRVLFVYWIKKYRDKEATQSVLRYYGDIVKLMSFYNCPVKTGDTPLEHAALVDKWFVSRGDDFTAITQLYIKAQYGKKILTEEEKNKVIHFYDNVINDLKHYLNKGYFYYYKYITLQI